MLHVVLIGGQDGVFEDFADMSIRFSVLQRSDAVGAHLRALTDAIHLVEDYEVGTVISTVGRILSERPVHYLLALTDEGVVSTAAASKLLGIPAMPVAVSEKWADKRRMRADLVNTEFAVSHRVCATRADMRDFFATNPSGIVVKDPTGAGSTNVHRARDTTQLDDLIAVLPSEPFGLLAEEFMPGQEVSVHTLTLNGRHRILGITAKGLYRNTLAERQRILVPDLLAPEVREALSGYCLRLLTRTGYRHGVCHIEVKIKDDGFGLLEINNRPGGNCRAVLLALTTGVSLLREPLRFLASGGRVNMEKGNLPRYQFAASHVFFDPIDGAELWDRLSDVDIHRLVLKESASGRKPGAVDDDILGVVAFASNDRDHFDKALAYLDTYCS